MVLSTKKTMSWKNKKNRKNVKNGFNRNFRCCMIKKNFFKLKGKLCKIDQTNNVIWHGMLDNVSKTVTELRMLK